MDFSTIGSKAFDIPQKRIRENKGIVYNPGALGKIVLEFERSAIIRRAAFNPFLDSHAHGFFVGGPQELVVEHPEPAVCISNNNQDEKENNPHQREFMLQAILSFFSLNFCGELYSHRLHEEIGGNGNRNQEDDHDKGATTRRRRFVFKRILI